MADEIELVDVSPESTWPLTRKDEFARLQAILKRIEKDSIDITSTDPKDWFDVAQVCRLFDSKGEELFLRFSQYRPGYDEDNSKIYYHTNKSKTPYKTIAKIMALCKEHEVSTRITKKDPSDFGNSINFLPEDADATAAHDLEEYGFFSMDNCYYSMVKGSSGFEHKAFTNFTMKVLFHMDNAAKPRRVIELVNYKNKKRVVDVETDKLATIGNFQMFCEGLGNFRFFGTPGNWNALKGKLFDEEGECTEVNRLGWNDDEKHWAWGNGIFKKGFFAADKHGFLEEGKRHFYLASANTNIKNRKERFGTNLKFFHTENAKKNFNDWAKRYYEVYGDIGAVVMLHGISCLFSDVCYDAMAGFPLLFIYGEGGSGKSSAVKTFQRLYGTPQDPLKISGKANTDKAKIATFAQVVNGLILLEEYNSGNNDVDELLKGLYDRLGYKRRTMDSTYNTETVPISSGVCIVGNYMPYNEPLVTRLILLTNNKNKYSQEEKERFLAFETWCKEGVTNVTHELLMLRDTMENEYKKLHIENAKGILSQLLNLHIVDRMVQNIAMLYTMYDVLLQSGMTLPFDKDRLKLFMETETKSQMQVLSNDGEFARFWEVCTALVNKGLIKHNEQFKWNGEDFYIQIGQLWSQFTQEYFLTFRTNTPGKKTITSKLENKSRGFVAFKDSYRIGDSNTSTYHFMFGMLPQDFRSAVINKMGYEFAKQNGILESESDKIGETNDLADIYKLDF